MRLRIANGWLLTKKLCNRIEAESWRIVADPPFALNSVVHVGFQEPGQSVKVAGRFNISHDGHQGFRVNQVFERLVMELQLARNRDHDAVQFFFCQCPEGAHAKLAAQHDVKKLPFVTQDVVRKTGRSHDAIFSQNVSFSCPCGP